MGCLGTLAGNIFKAVGEIPGFAELLYFDFRHFSVNKQGGTVVTTV